MKKNYLLPNRYRKIGWVLFLLSLILGVYTLMYEPNFEFFNLKVPAIFIDEIFGKEKLYGLLETNILNEISGIGIIIGGLLVAFSKEKLEDEYIAEIRLKSLVWAVYVNYGILFLALLLIYDLPFIWVMIVNMYTILIFFIIRFNWKILQLKKIEDEK